MFSDIEIWSTKHTFALSTWYVDNWNNLKATDWETLPTIIDLRVSLISRIARQLVFNGLHQAISFYDD